MEVQVRGYISNNSKEKNEKNLFVYEYIYINILIIIQAYFETIKCPDSYYFIVNECKELDKRGAVS